MIGTVYRHFPTVRTLVEALSVDALSRLSAAAAGPDSDRALRRFLERAIDLQLEDGGLEAVLTDLARTERFASTREDSPQMGDPGDAMYVVVRMPR